MYIVCNGENINKFLESTHVQMNISSGTSVDLPRGETVLHFICIWACATRNVKYFVSYILRYTSYIYTFDIPIYIIHCKKFVCYKWIDHHVPDVFSLYAFGYLVLVCRNYSTGICFYIPTGSNWPKTEFASLNGKQYKRDIWMAKPACSLLVLALNTVSKSSFSLCSYVCNGLPRQAHPPKVKYSLSAVYEQAIRQNISLCQSVLVLEDHYIHTNREKVSF